MSSLFAKIGLYHRLRSQNSIRYHPSILEGDRLLTMVDFSERKDKIEDGNRILIQHFQAQLTQQLEILHKTVAVSVTQQEQQLKGMEEDMQSFVLTKAEVQINKSIIFIFSFDIYPSIFIFRYP